MSGASIRKVIVVADLSRYSDIALAREEQEGPEGVQALNQEIQRLIGQALRTAGVEPAEIPTKHTGDGAILALDSAQSASRFGAEIHRAAAAHNLGKTTEFALRYFRVGIWVDRVVLVRHSTPAGESLGFDFAGTAISNAVRLEGACGTGEILIGSEVWAELPSEERHLYGAEEEVAGKRAERFRAHRRRVVEAASWEITASIDAPPMTEASKGPRRQQTAASIHYSGVVRDRVCRRLLDDWRRLANYLEIPAADQRLFAQGRPADDLWDWLDIRQRLGELQGALRGIDREDLARELAFEDPR